jgi:hypothetical protein
MTVRLGIICRRAGSAGEIAAKGSRETVGNLPTSAEIWAYFSSFYLKDKRITSKFNSGKWKKGSRRRALLGARSTESSETGSNVYIKVGRFLNKLISSQSILKLNSFKTDNPFW